MPDASIKLPSKEGEPTWEAAYLLPNQGQWTEKDFFKFHTNRMAELVDGSLEVLPMPTWLHQLIVDFLVQSIKSYLANSGTAGVVLFAPLPARLGEYRNGEIARGHYWRAFSISVDQVLSLGTS